MLSICSTALSELKNRQLKSNITETKCIIRAFLLYTGVDSLFKRVAQILVFEGETFVYADVTDELKTFH